MVTKCYHLKCIQLLQSYDDVIKWTHFSRHWPFAWGIHRPGKYWNYEIEFQIFTRPNVEFPSQRPVTQSFGVFFDLPLNRWLSKKSRRRWFETPLRSLWHHCNGTQRQRVCLPVSVIQKHCITVSNSTNEVSFEGYNSNTMNILYCCGYASGHLGNLC